MATIAPGAINVSTTPILSTKSLPTLTPIIKAERKPTVPRIDVEPLYAAVKGSISDAQWTIYKTTVAKFLLGRINQEELTTRLNVILSTPALEHAHNQFVLAIYSNAFRDPPEPGTASWADDKVVGKSGGGGVKGMGAAADESEKRLKHEVMGLSRRERKRLKTVQGNEYDAFAAMMGEWNDGRRIRHPDTGPASAGGFQKTNWDIEIRKRYTAPLFAETNEFPDATSIQTRMLPICYEYGLPSGHSTDCPTFVNIATETYIKTALENFFQRVSSNGPGFIRTAEYKRKVEREEERVAKGEIGRTPGGMLPVEVEEQRKRRPLCMEDIRLALDLGDSYLGQVPIVSGMITHSRFLDTYGLDDVAPEAPLKTSTSAAAVAALGNGVRVNGAGNATRDVQNGYLVDLGDPMAVEEDWGWLGGGVRDLEGLDSVLDGCLAVVGV